MRSVVFVFAGDLETPNGGYVYARKILPLLAQRVSLSLCEVPAGFPSASEALLALAADAILKHDRDGVIFFMDGLVHGALPSALLSALRAPVVALTHHPLGLEDGLSVFEKAHLLKTECEALAHARHVIVPSRATSREVTRLFGLSAEKITVAEPGILCGSRAQGTCEDGTPHIVSVGTLTPRKGFDVFLDALNDVRDLSWHTTIAGAQNQCARTTALVHAKLAAYGFGDRVRLAGQLEEDALSKLYSSGDIFSLASHYEGYGIAFAEALAHGLPVVGSGGGAVSETVPASAGFVCPAGNVAAFSDALRSLLSDRTLRRKKAEAAWQHGQNLPDWSQTAERIAQALNSVHPN